MKFIFALFGLMLISIFYIDDVYAELKYSDLKIESKSTLLFEGKDTNTIVVTIELTNNGNESFSRWNSNFYLVSSNTYFDPIDYLDDNDIVGAKTCPTNSDVPAKVTRELTFCYQVAKNFLNSSYKIELLSGYKDYCDDISGNQFVESCQSITKTIKSPTKTDYDEYKKKFILKNTDIKIDFNSIGIIEQSGFNILKINFDVTNLSSNKVNYYTSNIFAVTDEISYTSKIYDLTNLGYSDGECNSYSIELNPKLTKSYSYCFEVPQGGNVFDLSIREGSFNSCDGYGDCTEYLLNISNPKFIALDTTKSTTSEPISSSTSIITTTTEPKASFVDESKDPQSYVDRYNNEPEYKAWFDENYPQYSSIEEAVGLTLTEKIPSWIKNIFGWYAQDQVSEDELLNAIKYLINEKILIVN